MTPMEAWSIVSANLAHLVRIRRSQGDPKGYVDAETEAEVITFRALKEMQERMYPKPLTLDDLMELCDQPVWVQHLEDPELSGWGIVEGFGEIEGEEYLFLRGEIGYCNYNKAVVAYRYKPAEVNEDA